AGVGYVRIRRIAPCMARRTVRFRRPGRGRAPAAACWLLLPTSGNSPMHERSAWLLRGLAILAFAVLSIAVAIYAFAYLYREHSPYNRFAAQFAVSGLDVPAHFFGAV